MGVGCDAPRRPRLLPAQTSRDDEDGEPLGVHIRRRAPRPSCGGPLWPKGERQVVLADPPGVRPAEPAGAAGTAGDAPIRAAGPRRSPSRNLRWLPGGRC